MLVKLEAEKEERLMEGIPAIEVKDLVKSYQKTVPVLKGVSFCVYKKEIYGFLGSNGAGKSTTIEILEGYLPYDQGMVQILGLHPMKQERALRTRVGLMLQDTSLPPYLKVMEVLRFFTGLYPQPFLPSELLSMFQLEKQADMLVRRLSGGQRRKLDMAIAICGKPELVFLDEPTTGFDPHARQEAWKMIRNMRDAGTTVFLTTQHMEEADVLCDRVAILVNGIIATEGTPQKLKEQLAGNMLIQFTAPLGLRKEQLEMLPGVLQVKQERGQFLIRTSLSEQTMRALYKFTEQKNISLPDVTINPPTLEEVYFSLNETSKMLKN